MGQGPLPFPLSQLCPVTHLWRPRTPRLQAPAFPRQLEARDSPSDAQLPLPGREKRPGPGEGGAPRLRLQQLLQPGARPRSAASAPSRPRTPAPPGTAPRGRPPRPRPQLTASSHFPALSSAAGERGAAAAPSDPGAPRPPRLPPCRPFPLRRPPAATWPFPEGRGGAALGRGGCPAARPPPRSSSQPAPLSRGEFPRVPNFAWGSGAAWAPVLDPRPHLQPAPLQQTPARDLGCGCPAPLTPGPDAGEGARCRV